jgi:polyferredoxin
MPAEGKGKKMKKYAPSLTMWLIFEAVAVTLWLTLDNLFYLFNFSYIGTAIAVGLALYTQKKSYARNVVQFAVGLYMLVYLGFLCRENMQLEGFWYYLFLGVFEAATIHYAVAKIFGPLVFGRGWCGYACWTAMVLDLLPFRQPAAPRKQIGFIRYIVFAASLAFVGALFLFQIPGKEEIIWRSFLVGNLLYYAVGIALAYILRDNRAFCKYICPITIFLKPMSYFSLFRIKVEEDKCISCGKCERVCPMDVEVPSNSRKKRNATECILCMKCVDACPKNALKL